MLAVTDFLSATEPRMLATIECVADVLRAPCGLIYRYASIDGAGGGEAAFVPCTYWLVQCLAMAGQVDRATELFERVTAYANDVGLLSEESTRSRAIGQLPVGSPAHPHRVGTALRRQPDIRQPPAVL